MRLFPVGLICAVFALPALAETRITAVTLSTAGRALIHAEAEMQANGLRLPIRRADIDEFLQSLRLSDNAGGVPMLTMTGPNELDGAFEGLPFSPHVLTDLRGLIASMIGAPATVTRRGMTVTGVLMAGHSVPCEFDSSTDCAAIALRDEGGRIRQVMIDEATELLLHDSADQAAITRGLEALRAHARAHMLDVHLTSSNPDPRTVGLGWLQNAPAWKTAWRAQADDTGLHLTGWVVLENATGHDWDNVNLTLATGAVQTLTAKLYGRQADSLKLAQAPAAPLAAGARTMAFEAAYDVAEVQTHSSDSFSSFTLATPVSLRAGDVISLPFLQETLSDARLTLYRGGQGMIHPSIALEIVNPLPLRLPAGILTLYEDSHGHAGDAMIPELAPLAREVVDFAQDRALRISEHIGESQVMQSARIADGMLIAQDRLERRTTYRIEGAADQARRLTIKHPMRQGWDLVTDGGISSFDATRFTLDIAAADVTEHEVIEQRISATRLALMDLDQNMLIHWSGRVPDDATRARLREIHDLRAAQATLERQMSQLRQSEAQLIADQDRLVGLIVQLGDDSPATRERRARVDAIEIEIDTGRQEIIAAQAEFDTIQTQILALIRD